MGKRFAMVIGMAALGAAVALSATALAGTDGYHTYKGHVKHAPGSVRFSANLRRHRVRDMRFSNVHLTCDQGTVSYSHRMHPRTKRLRRPYGPPAVSYQSREKIDYGGASKLKIRIEGELFTSHRQDLQGLATGKIFIWGDLGASHTNCDLINGRLLTGPNPQGARWRAHRG